MASGLQIGNSGAVRSGAGAPGDDHLRVLAREWRCAVPDAGDAGEDSAAVVVAAVRELVSLFTVLAESAGRQGMPLSMATRDLIRHPAGPIRSQTLAMLAGAVSWFSRECGRPEAEVLDELASADDDSAVPPEAVRDKAAWRAAVRAEGDSWAKVVAAVRELLSCVRVPGGDAGRPDTTAQAGVRVPGGDAGRPDTTAQAGSGALPAVTDLVQDPAWLARYLPLAMLAGVVMRFSRDSGRPETEILDGLAASFLPSA